MEKIMMCPPTLDSIAKEVEKSAESVINIPPEWPECCIYRVPNQLRKVNEEAYTPKLLSIGPFHHEIHYRAELKDMEKHKQTADELKDMEKHKQRYLMDFLFRTQKSQKDLKDKDKILLALLKIIEDNEVKIRHCYSEECRLESDAFVKMILLDAVFIIELFLKEKRRKGEKDNKKEAKTKGENYCEEECDYILSKPWLRIGIMHDLILLENQLPFFVLEKLYRFALGEASSCNNREESQQIKEHKEDLKKEDYPLFVELSCIYFRRYDKEPKSIIENEIKVKHFTDLLRYLLSPDSSKKQEKESSCTRFWQSCPRKWRCKESSSDIRYCATKLDDAGLNFKKVKDGRCLLDIRPPQPGVLQCFPCFGRPMEVPQLVIDDYTETLLRNLMALEQCLYPSKTNICNYVFLLDRLIDDDKDVDLLVHKKVTDNLLGSSKIVAELINKLCDHIVVSKPSYFKNIAQKVNDHYEYPLNRTWATLKRVYFPNVFRGTATVVALIVLFITLWNFFEPLICLLELKYMC